MTSHMQAMDALCRCLSKRRDWTSVPTLNGYMNRAGPDVVATFKGHRIGIPAMEDRLREILRLLETAHAFEIEDPELETGITPDPVIAEIGAYNNGLLPSPFDVFTLEHGKPKGRNLYLCREREVRIASDGTTGRGIGIVQIETAPGLVTVYPFETLLARTASFEAEWTVRKTDGRYDVEEEVPLEDRTSRGIDDPTASYEPILEHFASTGQVDPKDEDGCFQFMTREALGTIRMLASINSRTSEVEVREPGKFANRRRRDKGLAPLRQSFVVRIVPRSIREAIAEDARRGIAREVHWRRSHRRTYRSGVTILVARHIVGLGKDGIERFKLEPNAYRLPYRRARGGDGDAGT